MNTPGGPHKARPTISPDKTPQRIAGMFDAIAPRYDLLNHLLSAGIDRRWRTRAIRTLQLTGGETLIDVCTGTADIALAATGAVRVIGVDFAGAMLGLGLKKIRRAGEERRITLIRGDALKLPVADGSADAVTIGFGIRNVQKPEVGCAEMARVLRRGGRLAIIEFGMPRVPGVRALYEWYFTSVLPFIGQRIYRDLEPGKPTPVIFPAGSESIDTFFGTQGRSPPMMSN